MRKGNIQHLRTRSIFMWFFPVSMAWEEKPVKFCVWKCTVSGAQHQKIGGSLEDSVPCLPQISIKGKPQFRAFSYRTQIVFSQPKNMLGHGSIPSLGSQKLCSGEEKHFWGPLGWYKHFEARKVSLRSFWRVTVWSEEGCSWACLEENPRI